MNVGANKGMLLVTMEPPPAMEEEFNDWYDTEHVPERAAIAGFESARRLVCVAGWPRYVATYDLRSLSVLGEPGYAAVSGEHFSPWSKRVLGRVRGQYRMAAEQCYPGDVGTGAFARMLLLRFRGAPVAAESSIVERVRGIFESRPGILQTRVFRNEVAAGCDFIALIESDGPFGPKPIERGALGSVSRHLDLVNEYSPYWTRGVLHGVYSSPH